MILDTIEQLKKAETFLDNCEAMTRTKPYYRRRIMDINSEIEELIQDLETHYA